MASRWADLDRPPLRAAALGRSLGGTAWRSVDVVASTASTNAAVAARACSGEEHGYVLVADHQSAGRGRLGRAWTAPPRSSLAVSVLVRPGAPASTWGWLPLLGGLAVVDALVAVCGLPARLKWPNDVLVPPAGRGEATQKVCGVLAEVSSGAVVLGIGLNVSQREEELPVPTATSLALAGAAVVDREVVARAVLRALAVRYSAWDAAAGDAVRSGTAPAYREACDTLGRRVRASLPDGSVVEGLAEGVDDDGHLLVDGRVVSAGDVVQVRPVEQAAGRDGGPAG